MTETMRARIQRHEGLRLVPYNDSLGFASIGYGHLILPTERFTIITLAEAEQIFDKDLTRSIKDLQRNLPWTADLPQVVTEVLVEMVYQMGIYKLLKFDRTLKCAYRRDFSGMASAMLQSLWARETPARAQELSKLVASAEVNTKVLPLQPLTQVQPTT